MYLYMSLLGFVALFSLQLAGHVWMSTIALQLVSCFHSGFDRADAAGPVYVFNLPVSAHSPAGV